MTRRSPTPHPPRRRTLSLGALVCVGALLAACAGSGVPGSGTSATSDHTTFELDRDSGSDADRLLAVGDFESAARLYRDALEENPESSVLREKLRTAQRSAAQTRAAKALDAAARGDAPDARRHLAAAESYAPDASVVRRARAQLEDTLVAAYRATELVSEAEVLMEHEPAAAQEMLAEARRLDSKNPRIVQLLREATLRSEAARAADRAEIAWDKGRRDVALRELESAQFAGRPVGHAFSIRARIEGDLIRETLDADLDTLRAARVISIEASLSSSAMRTIRDRLVATLTAGPRRLQADNRPAVAALLETECLRLGVNVETPALDAVTERAQIHIVIEAFEDATGGDVDGLRLATDLAARLEADARGGGATIGVIPPGPGQERLIAAHPRALRLTGKAVEARVAEGPRNASIRRVPIEIDTREELNPDARRAEAELREVEVRVSAVRQLREDAREELDRLEAIPFVRGTGGRRIGQGRANLELSLARAESRLNNLTRRENELSKEQFAARERMLATPQRRTVPIFGEHPLEVVEFRKVAKVTVALKLTSDDETLLDANVTGTSMHDETIAPALAKGNLAADPDETPDDAYMAREAAAHFTVVAAGRIRQSAEQAARRFLVDAREAERAGRRAEAAEGYALYLLSTAEVASPHRADAARALYDLAGVHVPLRTGAEKDER